MMIKRIFTVCLFVVCSTQSMAQVHNHAIGLRGGAGAFGIGGELSYQKGFSEKNRLELDLGWNTGGAKNSYDVFVLSGIYHWVKGFSKGLNGYLGPGGQLAYKNFKNAGNANAIILGVGGQVGLEYDFSVENNIPFVLGMDFRAMGQLGFSDIETRFGFGGGVALSIRYLID